MSILKIEKFGDYVGVVLPQNMLDQLGVRVGDTVQAIAVAGEVRLAAQASEYEKQMKIMERVMSEDREILRELAK